MDEGSPPADPGESGRSRGRGTKCLYALQELYELQQRRALERLAVAIALFSHGDPTTAPRADLETFRRELLALRGELGFLDQFGAQLTKGYQAALVR